VPELGMLGSERGALSNERPYRHQTVPLKWSGLWLNPFADKAED
jgi:hypothetical protein